VEPGAVNNSCERRVPIKRVYPEKGTRATTLSADPNYDSVPLRHSVPVSFASVSCQRSGPSNLSHDALMTLCMSPVREYETQFKINLKVWP
jgi:hypothetical protein